MFRWVKAPATKSDDLSSIPRTPTGNRETRTDFCKLSCRLLLCYAYTGTRACLHKINKA